MENTNSNTTYVDYPPIAEIYGSNGFLKVKPNMIDKGKIIFSFVTTDANKKAVKEKSFDVFLDTSEAEAFGKICENGMLYRWTCNKLQEQKAKGANYPDASWTSSLGVSKGEERKFYISKAEKGDYLFTAQKRFGTISKDGAGKVNFHPYDKKDANYKDPIFVRIPTSEFALVELSCKIHDAIETYRIKGLAKPTDSANAPAQQANEPEPEYTQESIPDIPMPEDITYPLEDAKNEAQNIPKETPAPVKEEVNDPYADIEAHKVTLTSIGSFEFKGNTGFLRVAMNGKELKPMMFNTILPKGTAGEKYLFRCIQKERGAIEFTCLAKDIGDNLLYCGLVS